MKIGVDGSVGVGVAHELDIDLPPDTETAVAGAAVQPVAITTGQTERPVDIMKVGGKILGHETYEKGEVDGVELSDYIFKIIGDEIIRDSGDVALVTSAAILAGMQAVGLNKRPSAADEMPELQRLSSVGRRHIENAWAEALPGREIGGLSLTTRELDDVARREEALRVIQALFAHGEVPVINENDAITHEEISFGSNDILAAQLAARMQQSDLFGTVRLFLLTDVNGVYDHTSAWYPFPDEQPHETYPDPGKRISVIEDTAQYRDLAGDTDDEHNIGGMASKFDAADIAKAAGVDMWIYNPGFGHREKAVAGEIGTYFPAAA